MAKADKNKVNPYLAEMAIATKKDRQSLYSECVRFSFATTGNLSCGFDAKDLIAWVEFYYPDTFDAKGKRIQ
jgi:hypothetical protein